MLIFSSIDTKNDCTSVFANGKIHKNIKSSFLGKTWSYDGKLSGLPVEYAEILCNGLSMKQVCPSHLLDDYIKLQDKKKQFEKTFGVSKVNIEDICLFDLVPEWFIRDFFSIQNEIIESVFSIFPKPENHDFLVKLYQLTDEISKYRIQHKLPQYQEHTSYNIFGTITGRFGLKPHSFPILNLAREKRSFIYPNNDFFVSLDYNGAEIRTAIGLAGKEQPPGDVYETFAYLFPGKTRDEVKQEILKMWYNTDESVHLKEILEKGSFIEKFWNGEKITSLMGREIKCEKDLVIPYMNQSSTAEIVFERSYELQKFFSTKQTKIAFIIHDEIILDMPLEERELIPEIKEIFSCTPLGKFVVRCKTGSNLGEMKVNG